jgi:RNA polymerase sigma-70 factor (ECF subfamily)
VTNVQRIDIDQESFYDGVGKVATVISSNYPIPNPWPILAKYGNKTPPSGSWTVRNAVMGLPGSQHCIQQLVDAHYPNLYRYAYRLTGSSADAEDLTQDTFCKAQLQMGQLRDPSRARAWLFSILRNGYLHRVRAEKQHRQVSLDIVGDLPEVLPEPLPEVDPQRLQLALNELPEVFRTPVILYYFEAFSYRDIAEQMDLPIGTVMSRLARAKAYLRGRLIQPAPAAVGDVSVGDGPGRATDGL